MTHSTVWVLVRMVLLGQLEVGLADLGLLMAVAHTAERDSGRQRETDRQRETQRDRERQRETERETERDRQRETERDRNT